MIIVVRAILTLLRSSFFNSVNEAFDTLKRKFEDRMKLARRTVPRAALLMIASFGMGACSQPAVRPFLRTSDNDIPRPTRIVVRDFVANESQVLEYQGIFRQQPANPNAAERRRVIADHVAESLSIELVKELQDLGFYVERRTRGTPAPDDALIIEGDFTCIDEGNSLRRFVVGLGSGAARVESRVRVYQGSQRQKLLEFAAIADSGKMPGAAVTAPAGAAAPALVSVGLLAGTALTGGFQNRADVAQLARSNANQAARYLSEFFARQGWIRPDQAKKARIAY